MTLNKYTFYDFHIIYLEFGFYILKIGSRLFRSPLILLFSSDLFCTLTEPHHTKPNRIELWPLFGELNEFNFVDQIEQNSIIKFLLIEKRQLEYTVFCLAAEAQLQN